MIYKIEDVTRVTTLSSPTIDRLIKAGKFPEGNRVNGGIRLWHKDDIDAWIKNLPRKDNSKVVPRRNQGKNK